MINRAESAVCRRHIRRQDRRSRSLLESPERTRLRSWHLPGPARCLCLAGGRMGGAAMVLAEGLLSARSSVVLDLLCLISSSERVQDRGPAGQGAGEVGAVAVGAGS